MKSLSSLLTWFGIVFLAALVGSVASKDAPHFYQQLLQPSWAPPGWVFGPVWTTLYIMMAIAAWLVWKKGALQDASSRRALIFFLIQLVLNALWSCLFFGMHLGQLAFIDIVVLWIFILLTLISFWRIQWVAGLLLVPYFLWVSFAAILNFAVWKLNPKLLS